MSAEDLRVLQREHALDPAPRREDLHVYHVPFDELTQTGSTEATLARAVRRSERVAVIGGRGHGKSSLIAYTTGPLEEGIAPIRVPVFAESDETVSEPKAFAQHLIRTITRYATEATMIADSQREEILRASSNRIQIPSREVVRGRTFGAGAWLLKGKIAAEVKSAGEAVDHDRSASEVIDAVGELLAVVGSHDELVPLVVLDDTDSWLNIPGADKSRLVDAFFGRVIRVFADFPCSVIVAVHQEYLPMDGFRAAEGFLETRITVPRFSDPGRALGRIFRHRAQVHGIDAGVDQIFDDDAIAALADHYEAASGDLRKVVWIAHVALQHACADDAATISRQYIEAGIAEVG